MNLGPSLSETLGFLFFVSIVWFFSGWNPIGTEVNEYKLFCPEEFVAGECRVREETAGITTYKANFDNQFVVVWADGSAPYKLANCAVRNAMNWSCASGPPDAQFVQEMIDGKYDSRRDYLPDWTSAFKKQWRAVPKWKWWLTKIREILSRL